MCGSWVTYMQVSASWNKTVNYLFFNQDFNCTAIKSTLTQFPRCDPIYSDNITILLSWLKLDKMAHIHDE